MRTPPDAPPPNPRGPHQKPRDLVVLEFAAEEQLAPWSLRSIRMNGDQPTKKIIRIVAALVQDETRRVLLVRKKGTRAFMQPGGKLHDAEPHLAALQRELAEE